MSWIKWTVYHDTLLAFELPPDVATFVLLHSFSNANKAVPLSIGNASLITGYSRRRVVMAVDRLVELGILEVADTPAGKIKTFTTRLNPPDITARDPEPFWMCLDSSIYNLLPLLRGNSMRVFLKLAYAAAIKNPVILTPAHLASLFSLSTRTIRAALNYLFSSTLISATPPLTAPSLVIQVYPIAAIHPATPLSVLPILPRVSHSIGLPEVQPSGSGEPGEIPPGDSLGPDVGPSDLFSQPSEVEK